MPKIDFFKVHAYGVEVKRKGASFISSVLEEFDNILICQPSEPQEGNV